LKIQYDREADAIYIAIRSGTAHHVVDIPGATGFSVDVDAEGNLVGIEVLEASRTLGTDMASITVEDLMSFSKPA
jgi:uncharacterized protein YuzE